MKFIWVLKKALVSEQESRGSYTSKKLRAFFKKLQGNLNKFFQITEGLVDLQSTLQEVDIQQIKVQLRTPVINSIKESIEKAYQKYNAQTTKEVYDYEVLIQAIHQQIQTLLNQYALSLLHNKSDSIGALSFDPERDLTHPKILIQENVLYLVFIEHIQDLVKTTLTQKIMAETDEENMTPLALACHLGDKRLLDSLITHGFTKETHYKIPFAELMEIARTQQHREIFDYLDSQSKKKYEKSILSMAALMGSLDPLPDERFAVVKESGSNYTGPLPQTVTDILRPVCLNTPNSKAQFATTPAGSKMRATRGFVVNKDSDPHTLMFFVDADKVLDNIEKPQRAASKPPTGLPKNTKREFMTRLTPERLEIWSRETEHNARYRDQNQAMGNVPAAQTASSAGFTMCKGMAWNYCHLIAYSMGGPDGQLPSVTSDFDDIGPQRENNLVVGTSEANAMMLIVESITKNLIRYHKIPEIYINVKTTFVPGLEDHHIAESVEYTIQDHERTPTRQITFEFEMLTRQKLTEAEINTLGIMVTDIFIMGSKVLLSPPTKKVRSADIEGSGFNADLTGVPISSGSSQDTSAPELDSDIFQDLLNKENFQNKTMPLRAIPESPFVAYTKSAVVRTRHEIGYSKDDELYSPKPRRTKVI